MKKIPFGAGMKTATLLSEGQHDKFLKHWSHDIHDMDKHVPGIEVADREDRKAAHNKFVAELDPFMKEILRPVAETLAMLDGNAFFGSWTDHDEIEWYEQYLPEAYTLFQNNGGIDGYPGEMGHVKQRKMIEANATTKELYEQLKVALILAGK